MRAFTVWAGLSVVALTPLLSIGPATAADHGDAPSRAVARPVLICATDAATRRAFTREHGAPPVFVTADEALSVRPSDPAWRTPRCMTEREHARYRESASTQAAAR